ncbi:unnamed protein product [Durusdinium trenchii]
MFYWDKLRHLEISEKPELDPYQANRSMQTKPGPHRRISAFQSPPGPCCLAQWLGRAWRHAPRERFFMAKPIVITLKRRASRSRSREDAEEAEEAEDEVMDRAALQGHLDTFQEELNTWLASESVKLGKLHQSGQELQATLAAKRTEVMEFLAKHGRPAEEEAELTALVVSLKKMLDEDKKAWAALSASLQDLAKRKGVPADKKPLELLKALLRHDSKSDDESYSYSD